MYWLYRELKQSLSFLLSPECSSCRKHKRKNACQQGEIDLVVASDWLEKKKAVLANRKALHTIEPEEQASRSVNATVNDDRLVFLCGWDLWNNLKIWNLGVNDKFSQQKEGGTIFKRRGAIYYSVITFIKIIYLISPNKLLDPYEVVISE